MRHRGDQSAHNPAGPEGRVHWERHYHGSALAGLGLAMSGLLSHVCIPSAFSYNHMVAHGSTPLLDEMFSTDRVRIVHDGAEVTRARKVAKILEWQRSLVLAHLRVCVKPGRSVQLRPLLQVCPDRDSLACPRRLAGRGNIYGQVDRPLGVESSGTITSFWSRKIFGSRAKLAVTLS